MNTNECCVDIRLTIKVLITIESKLRLYISSSTWTEKNFYILHAIFYIPHNIYLRNIAINKSKYFWKLVFYSEKQIPSNVKKSK